MKSIPSLSKLAAGAALVFPVIAFADGKAIYGLFNFALNIINGIIVPLIFAIAFLFFIFKIYQYFIAGGGNDEKVAEGRKFLAWSLVGFFVMFSVWGLVNIFVSTFGFNAEQRPDIPTFGQPTGQSQGGSPAAAPSSPSNVTPEGTVCVKSDPFSCPLNQQCVNGVCVNPR
jgi:hypothetical protein